MNLKLAALSIAFMSILIILKIFESFKKGKISSRLFFMWIGIWFSIGFFSIFPGLLDKIMRFVNMGNRMFFLTTSAILLIFIIIFYVSASISKLNMKVSKLIQEISILKEKTENKRKKKIT